MNMIKIKKQSQIKETWRRFKKNKKAIVGLVVIVIFILLAISADWISPYMNGITQNANERLLPPSAEHLFGTDAFGRDLFTRVIHGARISLAIGFITALISLTIGCILGSFSGYYGGIVDTIIMRFCDVFSTIPPILLMLAIVAALGPSLLNMLIAITISTVPYFVRFIRSVILTITEQEYIEAARAYGASDMRIVGKHILKNAIGPIIIQATMAMAGMILAAAALSFIGMGVQPPQPEWGVMLSDAKEYMRQSPYLLYFPGGAILLAALSLNLIGDGLRDALDPRLKS